MVEKAFQQALLAAFTPERIEELIRSEQAKTKIFEKEITNILSVIALLKKIDDYADACEREAVRDKENPNWE